MVFRPAPKRTVPLPTRWEYPSHCIGTEARYRCESCGREHTYCWSMWQTDHDALRPCVYCGSTSTLVHSFERTDAAFVKKLRKSSRKRNNIRSKQ